MKFDTLFQQVFLAEKADKVEPKIDNDVVPTPDIFKDDVAPNPLPTDGLDDVAGDITGEANPAEASSATLMDHITAIEDLVEKINGVSGEESLQKLVNNLDKEGTPFEGIANKTSQDIIRSAEILSSLAEQLKGFMLGSSK